jgi:hypothetical protein
VANKATWLGGGERSRRNRTYLEWPAWLRQRFWREVALRRKALGERKAREGAWEIASRVDAWRRRGADAKPCDRCGASVLWRREKGRPVPVTTEGGLHACG